MSQRSAGEEVENIPNMNILSVDGFELLADDPTNSRLPRGSRRTSGSTFQLGGNKRQSMLVKKSHLDVASFASDAFNPAAYLRSTMEADTEEAINTSLRSLMAAREKSITEIKKAVYKNHLEFLGVSQEIMKFESNLMELRSIQTELKASANALISAAGVRSFVSLDEEAKLARREDPEYQDPIVPTPLSPVSTTASEAGIRQKKIEKLCELIQDFEEYMIEGRHVILEGGNFREMIGTLNLKPITVYLLNDALVMASKKKTLVLSSSTKKWMLDRFWSLSKVTVTDLPDTKNMTNAIKVLKDDEYVILLADTPSAKRIWIQQMQKSQRMLNGDTASPLASPLKLPQQTPLRVPSPQVLMKPCPTMSSFASLQRKQSTPTRKVDPSSGYSDIPGHKISTLMSLLDRLNEETDKCLYDKAVELVDKIKYELAQMDPRSTTVCQLKTRLQTQVMKLAEFLYHEISDLIIGKDTMSQHVQRLVVLGFPDEAREKFLAARSDFIRERVKHLRFVGDVTKTVNDIGFATFSSIAASSDWYISSFKDNTMTAGFVFWMKLEINNYVNTIVKQVFSADMDFRLIGECLFMARRQCSSLKKIGLDMLYYLNDRLLPHINQVLVAHQKHVQEKIDKAVAEDYFVESHNKISPESDMKGVTFSAVAFCRAILEMLNDLDPILEEDIMDLIVMRLSALFESYSAALIQKTYDPKLHILEFMNIVNDIVFLANQFLPSLKEQLEGRFGRALPDLAKLFVRLEAAVTAMYAMFADQSAETLVPQAMECYKLEGGFDQSSAGLSDWLITMLPMYSKISRDAGDENREVLMHALLSGILSILQNRLCSSSSSLTIRGVQQVCLDVHFLMLISSAWLNDNLASHGLQTCNLAVASCPKDSPQSSLSLASEDWYDTKANELLAKYPLDFGI